ncbi:hypothetical protein SEUCBS140593_006717 [Sporothrix eucalyptigena]|uniref:Zn(2)-C6 fungal-type domain-containing protein n=1 Tax=Sporothrix eucalyptigena TaxID=1812306 RepID=A0ABP0C784_9PEZI
MGYLSYIESHNRHSLPHTPPDLASFGCSPAASYTSSAPSLGDAAPPPLPRGSPPKDLSWPHPKPPISPPMSSHDQPPPPPPSALRSPPRTVSPGTSSGMSMAATAAASLARASLASVSSIGNSSTSGNVTRISSITDAPPTTAGPAEETTTSPTTTAPAPASSGPQSEKLPSLSSIFGPSTLDRPLPPPSAPAGPPLSQLPPRGSYNGPDERPLSATTGLATSAYQRSSYGRPPSPALPTPQSAYLPPPQSTTAREQPPPPSYGHHHYDQRSPRTDDRQPAAGRHYPPSPRSYEQEQQQSSSHQWPDSRSGYVAVSKWSLQDERKTEQRSSYSEQKPSYGAQHSPEYQRYSQPMPPHQSPASSNDHYRQQHHQPPSHGYHGHGPHSNPPPPQQHASHSPVRGSGPVADGRPASLPHQGSSSSMSGSLSTTPASAAFPEGGVPPKDGMGLGVGPKIWTGQDFLPQFLRVAEVPGEGTCYFYDDGTHCKAVIDGEAVNPYWGVTKAGKPRKRLAIACMTCREKKIKCDPEYPRCVQCEKFGRLCRFKNAPRGGNNNSPGSSTAATEPDAHRKIGSASAIRPPQSPRDSMTRPLSPTSSGHRSNKRPSDYDHYTTASARGRSPPFRNRSPTLSDVSRGNSSVLPPPHGWGSSSSSSNQQSSQLPPPPPPPSSYPRSSSQQQYSPHSQYSQHAQQSPHSPYASHSQHSQHSQPPPPPSSAYDHHRHSFPDHHAYSQSQPRSQPPSPSQPDLPRMLLPPPRSTPDLPRVHDDLLRRSWQSDL